MNENTAEFLRHQKLFHVDDKFNPKTGSKFMFNKRLQLYDRLLVCGDLNNGIECYG